LFVVTLIAILAGVAIPQTLATVQRARAMTAARYLAARMALARAQAVRRSATVALRFDQGEGGITFTVFVDGNGNGVRTRDIAAGVDAPIEPSTRLSDLFPGVQIGLSPLVPGTDPVQIGASNLMSFTAAGTATSGSIYICARDRSQYAVRVLGVTGRARVLRYVPVTREWIEIL
jgi:type II secretory pathway pseudopilin PulG